MEFSSEQSLQFNNGLALFNKNLLTQTFTKEQFEELSKFPDILTQLNSIKLEFLKIEILDYDELEIRFVVKLDKTFTIFYENEVFTIYYNSEDYNEINRCHYTLIKYHTLFYKHLYQYTGWEILDKNVYNFAQNLCETRWSQWLPYSKSLLKDKVDLSNHDIMLLNRVTQIYYLDDWGWSPLEIISDIEWYLHNNSHSNNLTKTSMNFLQKTITLISLLIIGFGGFIVLSYFNHQTIGGILIGLVVYPLYRISESIILKDL
jgi:hypothetical protein